MLEFILYWRGKIVFDSPEKRIRYVSIGSWHYLGADGAMVKGLQASGGKWYYLDKDGKMATQPVMLTPDQDGALRYPGLAE